MTLSKLFLIYWGICAVVSFIYEWRILRKSNCSSRNFMEYLFIVTCLGFVYIPFQILDHFVTKKTKDWHDE